MSPDVEALKSYIGGLVLDVFLARGEIKMLQERLAEMLKELEKKNDPS